MLKITNINELTVIKFVLAINRLQFDPTLSTENLFIEFRYNLMPCARYETMIHVFKEHKSFVRMTKSKSIIYGTKLYLKITESYLETDEAVKHSTTAQNCCAVSSSYEQTVLGTKTKCMQPSTLAMKLDGPHQRYSTFLVRVPPHIISLQICTPKVVGA
jgi:hypothetical protein